MRRPIATALRLWRAEQGLSQADVAKMTGMQQPVISAHEGHTRELQESTIERYAAGYGLDPLNFLLAILTHAKTAEPPPDATAGREADRRFARKSGRGK